jgi:hypothetical protein
MTPEPTRYKHRVHFTINTEGDLLEEYKEHCKKQGTSASEQFTKHMAAELERHSGIENNSIGIKYGNGESSNQDNNDPRNSLDYYIQMGIEKGFKTIKQFQDIFEEVDQQTLDNFQQKFEAYPPLVGTILNAIKQVNYYRKIGHYLSPYNL